MQVASSDGTREGQNGSALPPAINRQLWGICRNALANTATMQLSALAMAPGMTPQKVIVRGAGSNALSFVIRFAARAGMLFIGAKLFGPATYGVYTLAVAVVELAVPLASLGLKRMIFPWLEDDAGAGGAGRPATHVLLDALLLAVLGSMAVASVVMVGAQLLPGWLVSDQLRLALIVLAPAVLGQVTGDIALAATRWTHKMRYEVIGRGMVEPYVATAVTLAAWYAGMHGAGMLVGYWAGSAALALFSLWSARHCLGPLSLRRWRPRAAALGGRVRALLPASGSDLLTSLAQRIDLYLVGFLLGDAPAGIYGVLRQLRTPITQVRQAFDGILVPLIARTMRSDGDVTAGQATAAATRVILTIQLGLVLFMAAAGEWLLGLFGAQYASGYPALIAMVLAEAVNGAFGVSELILYYRRPALALAVNGILIALALVLIPLLAPMLGILGASGAMLLAAIMAAALRRHWLIGLGVRRHLLHAGFPVAASLAGAAAGLLLYRILSRVAQVPVSFDRTAAPVLALAVYGAAVWAWTRLQPGVLSLARFRVS